MKIDRGQKQRGRPREFDRDKALERALELFWRRGYETTSLGELTEAMGVTPPSLYAAFGNKESLFYEALALYQRVYGDFLGHALVEEPTARGAIERMLLEAASAYTLPGTPGGCFVICAATNCSAGSSNVEQALRERRRAGERALRERIARAVDEGEVPCGTDAGALAKHYALVLQGMSVQARDGASRAELEAAARLSMRAWPGGRLAPVELVDAGAAALVFGLELGAVAGAALAVGLAGLFREHQKHGGLGGKKTKGQGYYPTFSPMGTAVFGGAGGRLVAGAKAATNRVEGPP